MAGRARKYIISGKVQGVGYRYFVARLARELQLGGWVRNLSDGRVEAYVVGPAVKLKKLEGELRIGPPRAEVRSVETEDSPADAKIEGFHIR
jgi:acylphosphatase